MMRNLVLAITAATALALSGTAQAAPAGPSDSIRAAVDGLAATENVQFEFEGHRHCWYDAGWHGPGWYWCGYAHRRGLGWGGPEGWHGWAREHHERREYREHHDRY